MQIIGSAVCTEVGCVRRPHCLLCTLYVWGSDLFPFCRLCVTRQMFTRGVSRGVAPADLPSGAECRRAAAYKNPAAEDAESQMQMGKARGLTSALPFPLRRHL